jgi:hypothetical protein
MAVLATILPVVSRSSALALELYRVAAESPKVAKEFIKVASVINGFASILKQVGTIIKEDDRLPSPEVRWNCTQQRKISISGIQDVHKACKADTRIGFVDS